MPHNTRHRDEGHFNTSSSSSKPVRKCTFKGKQGGNNPNKPQAGQTIYVYDPSIQGGRLVAWEYHLDTRTNQSKWKLLFKESKYHDMPDPNNPSEGQSIWIQSTCLINAIWNGKKKKWDREGRDIHAYQLIPIFTSKGSKAEIDKLLGEKFSEIEKAYNRYEKAKACFLHTHLPTDRDNLRASRHTESRERAAPEKCRTKHSAGHSRNPFREHNIYDKNKPSAVPSPERRRIFSEETYSSHRNHATDSARERAHASSARRPRSPERFHHSFSYGHYNPGVHERDIPLHSSYSGTSYDSRRTSYQGYEYDTYTTRFFTRTHDRHYAGIDPSTGYRRTPAESYTYEPRYCNRTPDTAYDRKYYQEESNSTPLFFERPVYLEPDAENISYPGKVRYLKEEDLKYTTFEIGPYKSPFSQ